MSLKDRIAFITGCSRGIGLAAARRLLSEGVDLALLDLLRAPMEGLRSEARALGRDALVFEGDVAQEEVVRRAVAETVSHYKRIDILVNVAGITGPIALIEDISREDWDHTIAVNLTSAFLSCKYVLPTMKAQKSGSIVNIASLMATKGKRKRAPYAASKWGMLGLSRSLSLEAGPYNVRVNTICPGRVQGERTELLHKLEAEEAGISPDQVARQVILATPLRKLITPEEIAAVVVFLASDESSGITGEEILVTAGKW